MANRPKKFTAISPADNSTARVGTPVPISLTGLAADAAAAAGAGGAGDRHTGLLIRAFHKSTGAPFDIQLVHNGKAVDSDPAGTKTFQTPGGLQFTPHQTGTYTIFIMSWDCTGPLGVTANPNSLADILVTRVRVKAS